jgi:hypothetical protein
VLLSLKVAHEHFDSDLNTLQAEVAMLHNRTGDQKATDDSAKNPAEPVEVLTEPSGNSAAEELATLRMELASMQSALLELQQIQQQQQQQCEKCEMEDDGAADRARAGEEIEKELAELKTELTEMQVALREELQRSRENAERAITKSLEAETAAVATEKDLQGLCATVSRLQDALQKETQRSAERDARGATGQSAVAAPAAATQCMFCGKLDAGWSTEEDLEMHYWKECPLLAPCTACEEIVELEALNSHLLEECEKKELYAQCETTGASIMIELHHWVLFLLYTRL